MGVKKCCTQNPAEWHDWFAWYPVRWDVRIQGERICWYRAFWITIQRKRIYYYAGDEWAYRLKQHRD